jgi:hypothetical protein
MTTELSSPETAAPAPKPSFWSRVRTFVNREDVGAVLFVLTLIGAAIQRAWFIFSANPPKKFVWSDMAGYVERAARLADPKVKLNPFDAFYPPGTHALMAPFFMFTKTRAEALDALQGFWFVLSLLTIVIAGLIAKRLFKHPLAPFIAATLVWTHWALTALMGFFSSENPFTFFMCLSLLVGLWGRDMAPERRWARTGVFALAGLLAGVTASIRPQFVIQAACIGLPLIGIRALWGHIRALGRKGQDKPKVPWFYWREAFALAVMFALPCYATMRLNSVAMGKPSGLSNNGGLVFYQGHCDVVHVHMEGMGFAAPVRIQRVLLEGGNAEKKVVHKRRGWDNQYFIDLGLKCIKHDGWKHLRRIYTNVADLFAPTEPWPPNQTKYRGVSSGANVVFSYALLVIIPAAAWLARRRWAERWLLLHAASILPVGIFFVGDPRYRIPYDVFGFLMVTGILLAIFKLRRDERLDVKPVEPVVEEKKEEPAAEAAPAPAAEVGEEIKESSAAEETPDESASKDGETNQDAKEAVVKAEVIADVVEKKDD